MATDAACPFAVGDAARTLKGATVVIIRCDWPGCSATDVGVYHFFKCNLVKELLVFIPLIGPMLTIPGVRHFCAEHAGLLRLNEE